ncbi:Myb-like DNA-binding domain containing protein [Trichomonas vaginalis G3]|uniref:Myb-like DNA-binding domain containing protein n=1 Tax=Trichomonas vaginalis (strain ATCC PRA-98 / G3) TaxID=412133 RepID=A2G7E0_TRIV3|nr:RNA polymerase II transcription regulator recruiting protein [Trichomonas vaginalis G3]EAX86926.1 Myb-like DNA-binding domain containing protein [Trichomonas vaginalis G3]KAI5537154.1 RNA polymerase II transcription regulator recruiting protein [Trichomonas vaginalis G3]|eukprot:XP_001299856.1 Myb-like DNA-binding domain containing protein [Trichomonas vaginalis G3]
MSEKKLRSNHTPKAKWSYKEDQRLIEAIKKYGFIKWNEIAKIVGGSRNGKQCRERWRFALSPDINNSPWNAEEDALLIKLYEKYGNKWSTIARFLDGRSAIKVKNRLKTLTKNQSMDCDSNSNDESPKTTALQIQADPLKIYDTAFDFNTFDTSYEVFPDNLNIE